MTPDALAEILEQAFARRRPRFANEAGLQAIIGVALVDAIEGQRRGVVSIEHRFDARDRVDFLVEGAMHGPAVAVEIKVRGGLPDVAAQLLRYAEHDEVSGILLVTTRSAHEAIPSELGGKPCRVLCIARYLL